MSICRAGHAITRPKTPMSKILKFLTKPSSFPLRNGRIYAYKTSWKEFISSFDKKDICTRFHIVLSELASIRAINRSLSWCTVYAEHLTEPDAYSLARELHHWIGTCLLK